MTIKEKINRIRAYIDAKGFYYDETLVKNFYLSLKSKPFVILAGVSGSGKTCFVRLFAGAIGAEYRLVSVSSDWSDSYDLFSYADLSGKFSVIDFIQKAAKTPEKPFILCLDEMNISRVEYYMSDILSILETREFNLEGKFVSGHLMGKNNSRGFKDANKYSDLKFPENLYIVGTINMDETTFPLSKKVLDRANTIELSHVDVSELPDFKKIETNSMNLSNSFLVSEYIMLNDCKPEDREYIKSICTKLQEINNTLESANIQFGYRVRDEIVFYMLNNKKADLLDENIAFDNQIMQRILPKIYGSSEQVKTMLKGLLSIFENENYETSIKKINFMIKRYEEDGFTSYWL